MGAFIYCTDSPDSDNPQNDPKPDFDTPRNAHGVKLDWLSGVPLCCNGCAFIEYHEFDDVGNIWAMPFCRHGLFLPVRKGTCKARKSDVEPSQGGAK